MAGLAGPAPHWMRTGDTIALLFGIEHRGPVTAGHRRHDFAIDERANLPAALVEPPGRACLEPGIDVAFPQTARFITCISAFSILNACFAVAQSLTYRAPG